MFDHIDREYKYFKLERDNSAGMWILKAYYYEYYAMVFWRTFKDIYMFRNFDSVLTFLRNHKPTNDDTNILFINVPKDEFSFYMLSQLGPSRPYEFINI